MDRAQGLMLLQQRIWPGHGLPEAGAIPRGTGKLWDPIWGQPDDPSRVRTLELPQERMTPETRARVPHVPTIQQMQPAYNPGLRIGGNETAQMAQAARERRAQELLRLQSAYANGGAWF
jgi:hypothetical protein